MLLDSKGRPIPSEFKPKLTSRGELEGTAQFRFYKDAVEWAVKCTHCSGLIGGVLRVMDPRLAKEERTWSEKLELQNECISLGKQRHQCGVWHENKKDVDQWLREVSK